MPGQDTSIAIRYHKVGGCLSVILFVFSFGIANLAIWASGRKWPAVADGTGVRLRNGKRFAWGDVVRVEHLTTDVSGTVAHKFIFYMKKGKWELPYQRLAEPQRVLGFIQAHLPEHFRPSP